MVTKLQAELSDLWTHGSTTPYGEEQAITHQREIMSASDYIKTEEAIIRLTEHQRHITQEEGTEPAYDNEYWANDEPTSSRGNRCSPRPTSTTAAPVGRASPSRSMKKLWTPEPTTSSSRPASRCARPARTATSATSSPTDRRTLVGSGTA